MPIFQPENRLGVSRLWHPFGLLVLLLSATGSSHAADAAAPPAADEALSDEDVGPPVATGLPPPGDVSGVQKPPDTTVGLLSEPTDIETPSWGIPPLPWRGALTISGMTTMPAYAASSTSLVEGFSLSGSSYVWQPWFLKLNGSMFLGQSQSSSGGGSGTSGSQNVGFNGNLLSASRFPFGFNAGMSKSASEQNTDAGGAAVTEVQTTSLGLTQGYAPISRGYQTNWNYNLTTSQGSSTSNGASQSTFGTTSQNFAGAVAVPLFTENPQSVSFGGGFGNTRNDGANAGSDSANLGGSHSIYLEDYVMSISTTALMNSTRLHTPDENVRSSVNNIASSMDWIPSDDYPLSIGSGLGFFNSKSEAASQQSSVNTVNTNVSARYPWGERWTFNGRFDANQATLDGNGSENKTALTSLSGGANWSGEGYQSKLSEWAYSLSYGANGSFGYTSIRATDSSSAETNANAGANIGQNFSRVYLDSDRSPIMLAISQGYGAGYGSSTGEATQTLNHAISASWAPTSESSSRQFSASATDGRSIGGATSNGFQQVSLGAAYQTMTSVYSTLSSQANLMYSRQEGAAGGRQTMSGNAGAQYSHARFANVSGLNYSARYTLMARENDSNSRGNFAIEHLVSQSWSWRYGLLGWQVGHSLSTIGEGGVDQTLTFSISRDFSGVL